MSTVESAYSLDLKADILPARSLGGLRVGTPLREMSAWLSDQDLRGKVKYEMVGLYEARYRVAEGIVELAVDIRIGKVARLTAYNGYTGALFGNVRPGMRAREALRADARLYYSEEEELILCRGVPGVALDISERDPDPARVLDLEIVGVSVFTEALDTAAGQRGDWG